MTNKYFKINTDPFLFSNKVEVDGQIYYVKSKGYPEDQITEKINIFKEYLRESKRKGLLTKIEIN